MDTLSEKIWYSLVPFVMHSLQPQTENGTHPNWPQICVSVRPSHPTLQSYDRCKLSTITWERSRLRSPQLCPAHSLQWQGLLQCTFLSLFQCQDRHVFYLHRHTGQYRNCCIFYTSLPSPQNVYTYILKPWKMCVWKVTFCVYSCCSICYGGLWWHDNEFNNCCRGVIVVPLHCNGVEYSFCFHL